MAALEQKEALFVYSGTQTKNLVQFSIWNRGTKNLNSIYDSLVKYVRKKNKKDFCENGACWKKSSYISIKIT